MNDNFEDISKTFEDRVRTNTELYCKAMSRLKDPHSAGKDLRNFESAFRKEFQREPTSSDYTGMSYLDFYEPMPFKTTNPLEHRGRVTPPISLVGFGFLMGADPIRTVGMDVASYGDDRTVLAFREGDHIVDLWSFKQSDAMESAGYAVLAIQEFMPNEFIIDLTGGWGTGIYAKLKEQGVHMVCKITPVTFNAKPRFKKYRAFNMRSEMWLVFQERMREGRVTLPPDPDLLEEMAFIRFKILGDGAEMRIEPKEETKKLLGRSPDKADAAAMSFYETPRISVI